MYADIFRKMVLMYRYKLFKPYIPLSDVQENEGISTGLSTGYGDF